MEAGMEHAQCLHLFPMETTVNASGELPSTYSVVV